MRASFRNDLMAKATRDTKFTDFVRDNLANQDRNRRNLIVAARVLQFLQRENKTKAWLAQQMSVSPQHVGKVLKGKGNMTLETIGKLEDATGLVLLVVPTEEPSVSTKPQRQTSWQGVIPMAQKFLRANFIASPTTRPY